MIDLSFDIETIPDQTAGARELFIAAALENFSIPSTLTKAQACSELGLSDADTKAHTKESACAMWTERIGPNYAAAEGEQNWLKTSFDGAHGELAVIGFALADDAPQAFFRESAKPEAEIELLTRFFAHLKTALRNAGGTIERPRFIGHRVIDFDLPFIFKRAVILRLLPPIDLKPSRYSETVFDTMFEWCGFGGKTISLDNLCKVLNLPSPKQNGIDGSKVWEYVKAGRIAEVAEYCKDDVIATRACFRRMTFVSDTAQQAPFPEWTTDAILPTL